MHYNIIFNNALDIYICSWNRLDEVDCIPDLQLSWKITSLYNYYTAFFSSNYVKNKGVYFNNCIINTYSMI